MCENGAEENWESSYDSTDDYEPTCKIKQNLFYCPN